MGTGGDQWELKCYRGMRIHTSLSFPGNPEGECHLHTHSQSRGRLPTDRELSEGKSLPLLQHTQPCLALSGSIV